jgi:hypothetical protein
VEGAMNNRHDLDGAGIYSRDHILGIEHDVDFTTTKPRVPQIEEIRALRGFDGETYINLNDLSVMMRLLSHRPRFCSASVFGFIKTIIHELRGD